MLLVFVLSFQHFPYFSRDLDRWWSEEGRGDRQSSRQSYGQETSLGHTGRTAEMSCSNELAEIKPGISRDKLWSGTS